MVNPEEETKDLGIIKHINDKSVIAIEWADRIADLVRKNNEEAIIIWVQIKYKSIPAPHASAGDSSGDNERIISWGII